MQGFVVVVVWSMVSSVATEQDLSGHLLT